MKTAQVLKITFLDALDGSYQDILQSSYCVQFFFFSFRQTLCRTIFKTDNFGGI